MSKKKYSWNSEVSENEVEVPVVEVAIFQEEPKPTKPKMPFKHWFDKQLKLGTLRLHQEKALWIYFAKKGLKKSEDPDLYNETFKSF